MFLNSLSATCCWFTLNSMYENLLCFFFKFIWYQLNPLRSKQTSFVCFERSDVVLAGNELTITGINKKKKEIQGATRNRSKGNDGYCR